MGICASVIFNLLINYGGGLFTSLLIDAGKDPIAFAVEDKWPYIIIIAITIWMTFGYQTLIMYAGLLQIPKSLYEAASIDGASGWQIFWKITFPHLRPTILLGGVYTVVDLAAIPSTALAKLVSDNVERTDMMYSYSAALSWLYTIVVLIMLGVVFILLKERKEKQDA